MAKELNVFDLHPRKQTKEVAPGDGTRSTVVDYCSDITIEIPREMSCCPVMANMCSSQNPAKLGDFALQVLSALSHRCAVCSDVE
jgi:hypothetical protein